MLTAGAGANPADRAGPALHEALITGSDDVWQDLARHPWPTGLADGTLPKAGWVNWLQQVGHVLAAERKGLLLLRSRQLPRPLTDHLVRLTHDCGREIDALTVAVTGCGKPPSPGPWPTTLGFGSWLRITIEDSDPVTALAAVYAQEAANQWIWQHAGAGDPDWPFLPWIHNWTNPIFTRTVSGLAAQLDELGGPATELAIARFQPIARQALLWQLRFLTMCADSESWWPP